MKISAFVLLLGLGLNGSLAMASNGTCEGKGAVHVSFCRDKDRHLCGVHSGVCEWKEAPVVVEAPVRPKSCVAKAGKEAHQSFCNGHDRQVCVTHSSMCSWE